MQPDQPQNPLQSYDFILNPEKPAGKSKLPITMPGPGSSMMHRLLFVLGGAVVLLIVLIVGASLLFGGSGSATDLTNLAATQTEIIREISLADQNAKSPDTKAYAASANVVVESDQAALLAAAKTAKIKINSKLLGSKKDATAVTTLQNATANGEFDQIFTQLITRKLTAYSQEMSALYPKVKSTGVKTALNNAYKSTQTLLASQKTSTQ
jgi:hypothetical protein